jgi:hypothetical protein
MIGQHTNRIDREWMTPARLTKRGTQFANMLRQQPQPTLCQIDREEEAAPGNEVAAIAVMSAPWHRDAMGIARAQPILPTALEFVTSFQPGGC